MALLLPTARCELKIDGATLKTRIGKISICATASCGDVLDASIIISDINPVLPKGMAVEGCVAALFTLRAATEIKGLQFSCTWDESQLQGSACSGEGLDAWEWESDGHIVIVGTEDGDRLFSRLKLGKSSQDSYPVTLRKNSIAIGLEYYPANTELTLHFLISTNRFPEKNVNSCWFAVDVPHQRVVEACR